MAAISKPVGVAAQRFGDTRRSGPAKALKHMPFETVSSVTGSPMVARRSLDAALSR